MRVVGGFGLAHGVGFGFKWEPSPSKLMEVNVFSNKWVVMVMGLGLGFAGGLGGLELGLRFADGLGLE